MERLLRGHVISYQADPHFDSGARTEITDGAVWVKDGRIQAVDTFKALKDQAAFASIDDHTGKYILPGFIDTHIHYPQAQVIASFGTQLLEWLNTYTFPAERRFEDPAHARMIAGAFLDELIRHGTTSAAAYASVHPQSVDAIMSAAQARNMRLGAGKVLMDREAPDYLLDTAETAFEQSQALIDRWHGQDRLTYIVTPRFAITSTEAQLDAAGALVKQNPSVLMQTHLSENLDEIAYVKQLFPWAKDYLDVYDKYGLANERALFGHCIYLETRELDHMRETGSVAVFCPTSNLFIGSGLLNRNALVHDNGVRVGLATDVGGGTSYSMLQTAGEAYKVLQLLGQTLTADEAYYWMTAGNAAVMGWSHQVGQLKPGYEADIVILDPEATPAMKLRRQALSGSASEDLFLMMIMGDDRTVLETYVAGKPAKTALVSS